MEEEMDMKKNNTPCSELPRYRQKSWCSYVQVVQRGRAQQVPWIFFRGPPVPYANSAELLI